MSTQIKDGSGACYSAKVDIDNRLHTQALTITNTELAVINGDSYGMVSGIISLTGDTQRDLIYFKNTGEDDALLARITFSFGTPTGNTGKDWIGLVTVNPTGGSLLSASDGVKINNNLGSSKTIEGTFKVGDNTTTATGGLEALDLFPTETGKYDFTQLVVVPQGFGFSVGVIPPSGTTAVDVNVGTTIIKQTIDFT